MRYGRLKKAAELEKDVADLPALAEEAGMNKDALYGKGNRGDQLPRE
ncbi:MAG: hypothetical protein SCH71_13660 [Desulfobulbaceae bacterium]|nr:hypothetical protein [Desulfobulbaceae bacterium]